MRSWLFVLSLLGPSLAHAQPAVDTVDAIDAVDDDGWLRGVSLAALRAHRPCEAGETMPGPGELIPCRPPIHAGTPQLRFGVDLVTGLAFGVPGLTSSTNGLGVELGLALTRSFELGARYELLALGEQTMSDRIAVARSQRLVVQARQRLFTDEVDREAFALGAGIGWALQPGMLGGDAPVARFSLAREVGHFMDDDNAFGLAIELAYTRGLAANDADTLLVSARAGFEGNVRAPRNLGTRDAPPGRLWSSAELYANLNPAFLGAGYTLGARLIDRLHLVGTASYAFSEYVAGPLDGVYNTWAVQGGLHANAGWPRAAPLYAEVQAGPVWIATDSGSVRRTLGDAELGVRIFGCSGLGLGVRLRADLDEDVELVTAGVVVRVGLGGGTHAACRSSREAVAYMPLPPPVHTPEPAPPTPAQTPTPTVVPPPARPVVARRAEVKVGGALDVAPQPPIEIAVDLGAVLLGGLVEVRLDPRLLPLARLRAAGLVEVRLEGPARALARFDSALRSVLSHHQISAQGWVHVPTATSRVRAVFTLRR